VVWQAPTCAAGAIVNCVSQNDVNAAAFGLDLMY